MKKIAGILLLFALILLCAACTGAVSEAAGSNAAEGANIATGSNVAEGATVTTSSEITVQSPMTLSNNPITFNGKNAYLRLKMVSGKYSEDWNPGAIMGTIWEGSFVFELSDESGNIIAQTDLSKVYSEPLVFAGDFNLEIDDYNNDGRIDFTLGQYASSNGRLYKLFTLNPDGSVEELRIKDHNGLFISDSTGYYSTKLQKTGDKSFSYRYYDNSKGKTFEPVYEWKDGAFIETGSEEILP